MSDQYAVIGNPIGHTKSPLIHALFAEQLQQDMSYIAIEGPLTPDLIAGRVESGIMSNPAGINLAREGRLRAIGVLADKRHPLLPNVQTFDEAGFSQVTVRQWAGVFGPPKLPREIVERLTREFNAVVKRPEVIEKMQSYGYAAEASSPERLFEINRDDLALWRKLIAEAGMALD